MGRGTRQLVSPVRPDVPEPGADERRKTRRDDDIADNQPDQQAATINEMHDAIADAVSEQIDRCR